MSTWREVALGDLCKRVTVGHVGRMSDQYLEDGVPFLRSQNVKPFVIETKGMLRVSDAFHRKLSKSALNTGDVVVVRTGYPGTAAVVPPELDGSNCADLVVITPGDELNPHVLAAVFNSSWGRSTVGGHLVGSAQQHFNVGSAKVLRLNLPAKREQDRIADVLCAFHDLIANNQRRAEVLEDMARAVYREWFVRFVYPGHEGIRLVDSPLGPIPDGWLVATLRDLATLARPGIQPGQSPTEVFDHYSIPAFDDGQQPVAEQGDSIRSGKYLLDAPAVLVSKLNPRIERTWFAEPATDRRAVTSTEFLILRPRERSTLSHLYLLARSDGFQSRLRELSGGTSTSHQRARPDDFLALEVVTPPAKLVCELDDRLANVLSLARALRRNARNATSLRDRLLPNLVSGRIDVSSLRLDALSEGAIA